jgi:hypothetical protein
VLSGSPPGARGLKAAPPPFLGILAQSALSQGRLGQLQVASGGLETALLGDGHDVAEVVQFHA